MSSELIEHIRKLLKSKELMTEEDILEMTSPVLIEINKEIYEHLLEDLAEINKELVAEGREPWNFSDMLMSDIFVVYNYDNNPLDGMSIVVNPPISTEGITVSVYKWVGDRISGMSEVMQTSYSQTIVRLHVIAILIQHPESIPVSLETDELPSELKLEDRDHKLFG